MMTSKSQTSVAIIGAGFTGLYTAKRLSDLNISAEILESSSVIGGVLADAGPGTSGLITVWPSCQTNVYNLAKNLGVHLSRTAWQGKDIIESLPNIFEFRDATQRYAESVGVKIVNADLISALVRSIRTPIRFNAEVKEIVKTNNRFKLRGRILDEEKSYTHVALAIPQSSINISGSPLFHIKKADTPIIWSSSKYQAFYSTDFWSEMGLSGNAFSQCGPLREVHGFEINSRFGVECTIGFHEKRVAQMTDEELKFQCRQHLQRLFGSDCGSPVVERIIRGQSKSNDLTSSEVNHYLSMGDDSTAMASEISYLHRNLLEMSVCAVDQFLRKLNE
ncbi:NAD(P)-binding protein [Pseudomonas putida group bacterium ESBL64]|uniref:NAD(P)-binding protein n=1 Tax=Pseudomonas putida group bacterium ESBL64 TaxID=3122582 RepID=UPI0030DFA71D